MMRMPKIVLVLRLKIVLVRRPSSSKNRQKKEEHTRSRTRTKDDGREREERKPSGPALACLKRRGSVRRPPPFPALRKTQRRRSLLCFEIHPPLGSRDSVQQNPAPAGFPPLPDAWPDSRNDSVEYQTPATAGL